MLEGDDERSLQQVCEHLLVDLRLWTQSKLIPAIVEVSPPILIVKLIDRKSLLPEHKNLRRLERRRHGDDSIPMAQLAAHRRAQFRGANGAANIDPTACHACDGRTINEADVCFGTNPDRLSGQTP